MADLRLRSTTPIWDRSGTIVQHEGYLGLDGGGRALRDSNMPIAHGRVFESLSLHLAMGRVPTGCSWFVNVEEPQVLSFKTGCFQVRKSRFSKHGIQFTDSEQSIIQD
jgi:hypothetical protein